MSVRFLPFADANGPTNMAADEVLLEAAAADLASLRFYGWSPPTLSLGYFQKCADRLPGIPWLRRASGGGAIMHQHELTYCLALPAGSPWQTRTSWLIRMHALIADVLASLGVSATAHVPTDDAPRFAGFLCFQHFTAGDLMIDGFKVVGSAQRRVRGALMQHGSILLAASPHAPMLPGIRELSGRTLATDDLCAALERAFARQTGWSLTSADWTESERHRIVELAHDKDGHESWNEKR